MFIVSATTIFVWAKDHTDLVLVLKKCHWLTRQPEWILYYKFMEVDHELLGFAAVESDQPKSDQTDKTL